MEVNLNTLQSLSTQESENWVDRLGDEANKQRLKVDFAYMD